MTGTQNERRHEDIRPLYGGILMGGSSLRMGTAKHLVDVAGATMIERVFAVLRLKVERVVLLGAGELPPALRDLNQLPDASDAGAGPVAALATALRWAPRASWLIVACDMPWISTEALIWLEGERAPGRRWAVLPRDREGRLEPLFAIYEREVAPLVEDLVRRGRRAPRTLADSPRIHTPEIPGHLAGAWANVNRPEDL